MGYVWTVLGSRDAGVVEGPSRLLSGGLGHGRDSD